MILSGFFLTYDKPCIYFTNVNVTCICLYKHVCTCYMDIYIYKHTGFERRVVVDLQSCFHWFSIFKIILRKHSLCSCKLAQPEPWVRTLGPRGPMERRGRAQGGGPLRLWGSSGPRTRMNPSKETALPGDLGTGDRQTLSATRPVSRGRQHCKPSSHAWVYTH